MISPPRDLGSGVLRDGKLAAKKFRRRRALPGMIQELRLGLPIGGHRGK